MLFRKRDETAPVAGTAAALAAMLLGLVLAIVAAVAPAVGDPGGDAGVASSPFRPLLLGASTSDASAPRPAALEAPPSVRPDALLHAHLRIPAAAIDATVEEMGFDRATGIMEVPHRADLVAWYGFTAGPGSPGNAVLAAHVDFRGERGAFWSLGDLGPGDDIAIEVSGTLYRYRITDVYTVRPEDADMTAIIGRRSGPQTVTLITCGGEFDTTRRSYEQRIVVHAERIE